MPYTRAQHQRTKDQYPVIWPYAPHRDHAVQPTWQLPRYDMFCELYEHVCSA